MVLARMTDYMGHLVMEATKIHLHQNNFHTDNGFYPRCSWYLATNKIRYQTDSATHFHAVQVQKETDSYINTACDTTYHMNTWRWRQSCFWNVRYQFHTAMTIPCKDFIVHSCHKSFKFYIESVQLCNCHLSNTLLYVLQWIIYLTCPSALTEEYSNLYSELTWTYIH